MDDFSDRYLKKTPIVHNFKQASDLGYLSYLVSQTFVVDEREFMGIEAPAEKDKMDFFKAVAAKVK